MLTIQPKYTQHSPVVLSFKSAEDTAEQRYETKTKYYEKQVEEFDNMLKDKHTPSSFKKIAKIFKVISEALLEGWAVMWGASKGAKIIKTSVINETTSKVAKEAKHIFSPLLKGLKKTASNITTSMSKGIDNLKQTKFATNLSEKMTKLTEKLDGTTVGHYIVKGLRAIGKFFKAVGRLITLGAKKVAEPFKKTNVEAVYDKVSKATATTLGVGAGAAGAYNAATRPEDSEKKTTTSEVIDNSEENEFEEETQWIRDGK